MNSVLQTLIRLKCFINDIKLLNDIVPSGSLTKQLLLLIDNPTRSILSRTRALLCRKGQSLSVFNEQVYYYYNVVIIIVVIIVIIIVRMHKKY